MEVKLIRSFIALYIGMIVVNVVIHLNKYFSLEYFDISIEDFIYPIKFAIPGAIILSFVKKIDFNLNNKNKDK